MTEEQLNKAMSLSKTIEEISGFIDRIESFDAELAYRYDGFMRGKDSVLYIPKFMKDIFRRHDAMIRQEIKAEIQKLKEEIKTI